MLRLILRHEGDEFEREEDWSRGQWFMSGECYSASGNVISNLLDRNIAEITNLCQRYRARRLAVFGSIVRTDFESAGSDADFLVGFEPVPVAERMHNYLGLREALGALLSRSIDLIEDGTIRNPYILRKVKQKLLLFFAA
jgi:hypothetical protein